MPKIIFLVFLVLLSVASVFAQCPRVTVTGPSSDVAEGDKAVFSVSVTGGDKNVSPTYNWSISAGVIETGQGTALIQVDTSSQGGNAITATVDVWGYDRSCNTAQSSTASVTAKAVTRKYDEFPYLGPAKLEFARLDELAISLLNEPSSKVHIIFYAGPKAVPGAIKAWTDQTIGHLAKRGVAKSRMTGVDGGYRDSALMEIFILPPGGDIPYASPTVDPPVVKKPVKKVKSKKV